MHGQGKPMGLIKNYTLKTETDLESLQNALGLNEDYLSNKRTNINQGS